MVRAVSVLRDTDLLLPDDKRHQDNDCKQRSKGSWERLLYQPLQKKVEEQEELDALEILLLTFQTYAYYDFLCTFHHWNK